MITIFLCISVSAGEKLRKRFERPENNFCWLAPFNIFQKKGRVHLFGVYSLNKRITVSRNKQPYTAILWKNDKSGVFLIVT